MSKDIEVEARFLGLDRELIEKKLEEIGADKTGDFFFKEWLFSHPEWADRRRRVRVRADGKTTWLTYKANETWKVDGTEEVEVTTSSAENTSKFLKAIDLPLNRYQEKKRIRYELEDITFDLDFWPKLPMILEIEAPSEERVKEGAQLLGLSWDDAVFEDLKEVHRNPYGIDLDEMSDYRFE